jgi:hypothetical protein
MKTYLSAFLFVCFIANTYAQKYSPTTHWPFLYEDFQNGTVYFSDSAKDKQQKLNIHLLHATLWHVDGENVLLSDPKGIIKVSIGTDSFIYMNGELVRLVKTAGDYALVESVKGNYNAIVSPGSGAYGMSTQSLSASKQSSIGVMNYMQTMLDKKEGANLPLIRKYYFILSERIVQATRKEVEKAVSKESLPTLRAFVKEHKIKWNEEESLISLLDFLLR